MRKLPRLAFIVACLAFAVGCAGGFRHTVPNGHGGLAGDPDSGDLDLASGGDDTDLTMEEVSQNSPEGEDLAAGESDRAEEGATPEAVEENDVDVAEEEKPQELGEGFCGDDIYARYLTAKYLRENPAKVRPVVSRRSKRARMMGSLREVEAMHYAAGRLAGPMSPYYGALPVVANPRVEFWLRYFKNSGRRTMLKYMVRGESMKDLVHPLMQREGMPKEFIYLAMIESGFNNDAFSSARATGTWQFMQGTAKLYGLKVSWWMDERRDPVKSTIAAARLLRDLYEEFGDWYLAMAAYNAGSGKVNRAIRKTGSRDFWRISQTEHLRQETKDYVPKMLAALILSTGSQAHGFEVLADQQDAIPMTTALVREPVLLSEVADRLGLCESDLRRWNPEIVRNVVPPTKDGYPLRMPEQYVEAYPAVEPSLSVLEISDVLMHRIRPGDSLSRIARTYKVSVKQIMQFNPNLQPSRLRLGREIAVPVPGVRTRSRLAKNISENVETPMMDLADDLREAGRDRICHKTRRAGIDYATSGKKSQLRKASVRVQQPKKRLARDVRRTTRTRR